MIKIFFNNEVMRIEKDSSVTYLLYLQDYPRQGVAVIINQKLISYAYYDDTLLVEGDVVEVMLPMQGG